MTLAALLADPPEELSGPRSVLTPVLLVQHERSSCAALVALPEDTLGDEYALVGCPVCKNTQSVQLLVSSIHAMETRLAQVGSELDLSLGEEVSEHWGPVKRLAYLRARTDPAWTGSVNWSPHAENSPALSHSAVERLARIEESSLEKFFSHGAFGKKARGGTLVFTSVDELMQKTPELVVSTTPNLVVVGESRKFVLVRTTRKICKELMVPDPNRYRRQPYVGTTQRSVERLRSEKFKPLWSLVLELVVAQETLPLKERRPLDEILTVAEEAAGA